MSGILDKVDSRTQLVGQNRLELLTFRLNGSQIFAINVFKVQEVVSLPRLTIMPHSHPSVVGVSYIRGHAIPVIDLSHAIGRKPIKDIEKANLIIAEYNLSVQAFLVGKVDNIVNLNWEDIQPPPVTSGRKHYLTAITRLNEEIVEIIDVERVLAEIVPFNTQVSKEILDLELVKHVEGMDILVVDDSLTALAQVKSTIGQLGLNIVTASDGRRALNWLKARADKDEKVSDQLLMVITDAEMPEMDGYRLTSEIRGDPRLDDLFIALHTSLSGNFNKKMVEKVGCNDFLSKFQPDDLALLVQRRIRQFLESKGQIID
jgi:two-component system chemotaxis response regulator CheV